MKEIKLDRQTLTALKGADPELLHTILDQIGFDQAKGFLLTGNQGLGKTHDIDFFCGLVSEYRKYVVVVTEREIVKLYKQYYMASAKGHPLDYRMDYDMVIDDFGIEPVDITVFGTVVKPLEDVILERYINKKKKTSFTTNLNMDQIKEKYGSRIHDRLWEMCNIVNYVGTSYRKE